MEVPDDGPSAANHLAFQLYLQTEDTVRGWMLRPHVEEHALVVELFLLVHVVVGDDAAELLSQPLLGLVETHLLAALVSRVERWLFGSGRPDIDRLLVLGALIVAGVGHVALLLPLNWTGTAPTLKSFRSG